MHRSFRRSLCRAKAGGNIFRSVYRRSFLTHRNLVNFNHCQDCSNGRCLKDTCIKANGWRVSAAHCLSGYLREASALFVLQ